MIDATKFEPQGKPTVAQVEAVWNATPNASARKVQKLLEQRGFDISFRSVARYKKNNWLCDGEGRGRKTIATDQHTPAPVNKAIDEALASLPPQHVEEANKTAATGIEQAINGSGKMSDADYERIQVRAKELANMTPAQLVIEQDKARTMMNIILMEEVARRAHVLALIPKDTGAFMSDAADASKAFTGAPIAPTGETGPISNGDGAKLIEATSTELSPLSQAIRRIKQDAVA